MRVCIPTYIGSIVSLQVPNKNHELVDVALGYNLENYSKLNLLLKQIAEYYL